MSGRTYSGRLLALSADRHAMAIGNYRMTVEPMRIGISVYGQGRQGCWALWMQWPDGRCRLVSASQASEQGHWQAEKTLWLADGEPAWLWVTCDDQLILYRALTRGRVDSAEAMREWHRDDAAVGLQTAPEGGVTGVQPAAEASPVLPVVREWASAEGDVEMMADDGTCRSKSDEGDHAEDVSAAEAPAAVHAAEKAAEDGLSAGDGASVRVPRRVRYRVGVLRSPLPAPEPRTHPPEDMGPESIRMLLERGENVQPFPGLFPGARFARTADREGDDERLVGEIPLGEGRGFYLLGVPSGQNCTPPVNLPEYVHYLPSMLGRGYWVRYIPWEEESTAP